MQGWGGRGACSPRKFLDISSEANFGQKQTRSIYMIHRVLHPVFGCPCMHVQSQPTLNFHDWQNAGGVASLERQLVNPRVPEILIYLSTYIYVCPFIAVAKTAYACALLVVYKQTHIAATRLIWQWWFVRLMDHFQMVGHLKYTVKQQTPLPMGLACM